MHIELPVADSFCSLSFAIYLYFIVHNIINVNHSNIVSPAPEHPIDFTGILFGYYNDVLWHRIPAIILMKCNMYCSTTRPGEFDVNTISKQVHSTESFSSHTHTHTHTHMMETGRRVQFLIHHIVKQTLLLHKTHYCPFGRSADRTSPPHI